MLTWIENSNYLHGYWILKSILFTMVFHFLGSFTVFLITTTKNDYEVLIFHPSLKNRVSRPFVREGRRWSKIVCPEWQRCCPISPKPQAWLTPAPDLWVLVLTPCCLPVINLPWKLSSISWTNSITWSSLISYSNTMRNLSVISKTWQLVCVPRPPHCSWAQLEVIVLTLSHFLPLGADRGWASIYSDFLNNSLTPWTLCVHTHRDTKQNHTHTVF